MTQSNILSSEFHDKPISATTEIVRDHVVVSNISININAKRILFMRVSILVKRRNKFHYIEFQIQK